MPPPKRFHTILVGVASDYSYGRGLLLGVIRYARSLGNWRLVPLPVGPAMISHIRRHRPDGILAQIGGIDTLTAIARTRIPTINLSSRTEPQPIPRMIVDPVALARMAVAHFVGRGFQHFAFAGPESHGYSRHRRDAFAAELARRGLPWIPEGPGDLWGRAGANRAARWLRKLPKPVAVLASNDDTASHIIRGGIDAGFAVPDEVAVLGVDNDEIICELSTVPISSVDVDAVRIGMEAARRLDAALRGEPVPAEPIPIEPHGVVARASTATLVFRNKLVGDAMQFLHEHEGEPVSVKEVLTHLGVSRRTLERHFQAVLGHSPRDEIEQRRLLIAERLLRETDLTAKEISRRSGFGDPRLLIHAFHRRHHRTPMQFRALFEIAPPAIHAPTLPRRPSGTPLRRSKRRAAE